MPHLVLSCLPPWLARLKALVVNCNRVFLAHSNELSAIPNLSFSAPVRPGQDPSPHPPVSTAGMPQEFQAQGGVDRDPQVTPNPPLSGKLHSTSVRVLGEGEQSRRVPDDSASTSAGIRRVPLADDPDAGDRDLDDDDSDVDSAASVTVDRSAVRLANFVYECYPGSRPVAAPPVAPRCDFEAFICPVRPRGALPSAFCALPKGVRHPVGC